MSKIIEKELTEMNRLKRLELEFLFFKAKMDNSILQKYRNALSDVNPTSEHVDSRYNMSNDNQLHVAE